MGHAAWLADVDGNAQAELLFRRTVRQLAIAQAASFPSRWTQNYTLALPAVALRFDDATYTLAYLVTTGAPTRIRSRGPLFFAPRLSRHLILDGDPRDWEQIEYHDQLAFAADGGANPTLLRVAWDDLNLYLAAPMAADRPVLIALDTDLAGDFADATLSADDWLIELAFPAIPRCAGPVVAQVLHPASAATALAAAIQPMPQRTNCELELALPLADLGLASRDLVPTPGWVAGSQADETRPWTAPFRRDDPTTWTTLVFMAAR